MRVGETWLPKLEVAGSAPARSTADTSIEGSAHGKGGGAADVPLLKLFEFLTASLCLYVIEEEPPEVLRRTASVYGSATSPTSRG